MPPSIDSPRIAYLTGRYPAVSHTFILREIQALRALGRDVMTCSVRTPSVSDLQGAAENAEAEETFYIQATARRLIPLLAAQVMAARAPARYFSALAMAIRLRTPGLKALLWQVFYFAEATVLAHRLVSRNVSHLHNHFAGPSASVAMIAAQIAGIPFSFTLHGPADLLCPERWKLAEKAARAKFVACISQYARSQLMLHSDPEHWHKYHIVHCGVRPDLYDRPKPVEVSFSSPHLVFVGRLAAAKGLLVLWEAYQEARQAYPGLRLTIVGDGDERARLDDCAAQCGGDLELVGYKSQDEVAEILASADIFVLPSFAEGVPVVLMEAMASRLPVIATRITGVPELVEHGKSGLLVPPGDASALADAIRDLAGDPEKRRAMGEAGRARILADFDVGREAAGMARLLEPSP